MKKLFPFLLVCAAGAGLFFFLKSRSRAQPNPKSLQANKPAPPIATSDDWMKDKGIVYGLISALPTIVGGLAPGRWFNPDDTRQIYDENAAGENVSNNYDGDLEGFST